MNPTTLLNLSMVHVVCARFNKTTTSSTWEGNSVQYNNDSGNYCYFSAPSQTNATICTGGHYGQENELIGNQTYPVEANNGTRMCLSGRAKDGTYKTLCMNTNYDKNFAEDSPWCRVALGLHYVSD